MDEADFWQIVHTSKGRGGDEAHASRLRKRLLALPSQDIASFGSLFTDFRSRASSQDLWAAGLLLNGGHATDDGFEYFCNWLISRGCETFERALADPDSLANEVVALNADRGPCAEFESYGYAAIEAYRAVTGAALVDKKLSPAILPGADEKKVGLDYTAAVLAERLPRLWQEYGKYKLRFDQMIEKTAGAILAKDGDGVDVPGLGTVHVGDTLIHGRFGSGTIKKLTRRRPIIAVVSFAGTDHSMMLDDQFFSRS